jgi:hypothetical protein
VRVAEGKSGAGAPELALPKAEAGLTFRAEMAATNLLLGYWRHLLLLLVAGLLAVLVWGQWNQWVERQQRGWSAKIAEIERKLPAELPMLPDAIADGKAKVEDLEAPADALGALAEEAQGAARAEAWLKAAELYRIAGKTDLERTALQGAAATDVGVLTYAAESALAALDLEDGKGDAAIHRLEGLRSNPDPMLAQSASLDLGLALESLGRTDEASRVYADFVEKWPQSKHLEQIRARQARLSGTAAAPAPAGAGG